jgi:hypothetical protein
LPREKVLPAEEIQIDPCLSDRCSTKAGERKKTAPLDCDTMPDITQLPDGTKIVTEMSTNDDGKPIKVTRKIKTTTRTYRVHHSVAERKKLSKFGDSAGLPIGPDTNSTTIGDIVHLKLSFGIKVIDLFFIF